MRFPGNHTVKLAGMSRWRAAAAPHIRRRSSVADKKSTSLCPKDQHPNEPAVTGKASTRSERQKLLYTQPHQPTSTALAPPHHPRNLHSEAKAYLVEAKMKTGDKSSPSSSPQQPCPEHQGSPDRHIREHTPPAARQLRPKLRREGDRAPANLFQTDTIIPNSTAPPRPLPLPCTCRGPRFGVPPLSRRRSSRRRGRGPQVWPAADRGNGGRLLFTSRYSTRGGGK